MNYTWQPSHKLKVLISGNSSYRWDVNLQNGGQMYVAGDTNTANITIYHDDVYPSKIALPGNNPYLAVDENAIVQLTVHPNPTKGLLSIDSSQPIEDVSIYDLKGQLIVNKQYVTEINLEGVEPGIYIVKVIINDMLYTQKVIKN